MNTENAEKRKRMSYESMDPREFLELSYEHACRHALLRRGMLATAAGAGALALGGDALAQTPRRGGILRCRRNQEPDSLDPHKAALWFSKRRCG